MRWLVTALVSTLIAMQSTAPAAHAETREIIVAGGCFWCVEADFEKVRGVREVISGYTGGTLQAPTYKQVSRGGTGHYEAVRILYDDSRITAEELYALFFRSIDPTDAGGQFCDRGDSYRTAIFANGPVQKRAAEAAKAQAQVALGQKIVTPVLQAGRFWPAESYHQDYYKGSNLVLTRFGPLRQSTAYKRYREACGRDTRVRALWGSAAAFAGG
ncbi:peptide-methionine (S)-S-oxide reductase MsrA [Salipiger mangrovisoli]|uniref:Peptide methionine sulfoxide reductase MsrA n=1 Tax=Salipiger mangrovisoli TaxID=2865933 RepID=A0ABR9WXD2_9RHOB|nr:peptide-methionine (S)-S-oxide reductase MsrA [Salipiger mangrovisoli]